MTKLQVVSLTVVLLLFCTAAAFAGESQLEAAKATAIGFAGLTMRT